MARNKGTFTFAANFQVKTAEALDPRVVVATKSELIAKDTWPYDGDTLYLYNGLIVAVTEDKAMYMLIDSTKALNTDYSGWKQLDVSAQQVVEIIDNLESQSSTAALSANQGYVLNNKITTLESKLTAIYTYKGSFPTYEGLIAAKEQIDPKTGDVYNIEASFTIDGKVYPAGTNVAYIEANDSWDPLGGSVDLSAYYTKTEVDKNFAKTDGNGNILLDSGKALIQKTSDSEDAPTVTLIQVTNNGQVSVGENQAPLVLESASQPIWDNNGTATKLATETDLDTLEESITTDIDTKLTALGSKYVAQEEGKELIPTDQLTQISTNKTNISNITASVNALTSKLISAVKTDPNLDSILTKVEEVEQASTTVNIKFEQFVKKADTLTDINNNTLVKGDQLVTTIPAAEQITTSSVGKAGVMTAQDKTDLENIKQTLEWQSV